MRDSRIYKRMTPQEALITWSDTLNPTGYGELGVDESLVAGNAEIELAKIARLQRNPTPENRRRINEIADSISDAGSRDNRAKRVVKVWISRTGDNGFYSRKTSRRMAAELDWLERVRYDLAVSQTMSFLKYVDPKGRCFIDEDPTRKTIGVEVQMSLGPTMKYSIPTTDAGNDLRQAIALRRAVRWFKPTVKRSYVIEKHWADPGSGAEYAQQLTRQPTAKQKLLLKASNSIIRQIESIKGQER